MTALQLLAYIGTAIGAQVLAGIAVLLWQRQRAASASALAGAADPSNPAASAPSTPPAWIGWREFRVASRVDEDPARTQCSFQLEPVDGVPLPPFRPGQFLTFSLSVDPEPGSPAAGLAPAAPRPLTRCYSLSAGPDPHRYRITVKRVPPAAPGLPAGRSSNHFHDRVQVGDVLRVQAPAGRFFIDADPTVPAVLVAGGIGITPMMSMLEWCAAEQPQRSLHLFHGVRCGREQAFKGRLAALSAAHPNLHCVVACSRPDPGDRLGLDFQHAGHVDIDLLRRTLPHGRHRFYICGPTAMMDTLVPALHAWGVAPADIHHEAFGPASTRAAAGIEPSAEAPTAAIAVAFRRSGRTLVWEGQDANLLEFAERHGVAVESGCRAGSCGACETRLISGSVRYPTAPDHAIAPGHCLLCVGRPTDSLVLEA